VGWILVPARPAVRLRVFPRHPAPGPTGSMASQDTPRRSYTAPTLQIYGDLAAITRTVNDNKNKNDSLQGQSNLKT
jgi:hypothetical protein